MTTDYGVPVEGYATMSAPVRNATEACFEHQLIAEPAGTVPVALVNRGLALGVYQVFRISQLPFHTVWRMMGEGTYALAMEPSTNRDAAGRTRGSGVSCNGSSPASSAGTTWRSARCPGRTPSASSRPGCHGCHPGDMTAAGSPGDGPAGGGRRSGGRCRSPTTRFTASTRAAR